MVFRPKAPLLHFDWVSNGRVVGKASDVVPENGQKVVLFLHGLLGTGRNLAGPARKVTAADPNLLGLLIDARGHGQSSRMTPPLNHQQSTFANATMDIIRTLEHLGLEGRNNSPVGVIGHSFGGRLALQYSSMLSTEEVDTGVCPPKVTWMLDTVPGVAHSSVANVIHAVSTVSMPVKAKSELVTQLIENHQLNPMIANWMTTNLIKSESGENLYDFNFDIDVVKELLEEFPNQDFYKLLDTIGKSNAGQTSSVEVVRAGNNKEWKNHHIEQLQSMPHVNVHTIPNAGHWVHVDALDALVDLLTPSLKV